MQLSRSNIEKIITFSYISEKGTLHFSAQARKIKKSNPLPPPPKKNSYIISGSNIKKNLIFFQKKLFLIFSRKDTFLIFLEMKP